MADSIKTTLHAYWFDTRKPNDAKAFSKLHSRLIRTNGKCFETWGGNSHYCPKLDGPIELETEHLFDNQWNSTTHRVFDWAQDHPIDFDKRIKRGHYLDITNEMRELRRNRMACGYCGKQEPAQKGNVFCPHCIGSQYLKESELYMLRMRPVSDGHKERAPLTPAESAHLVPLYRDAQIHGNTERDKTRIAKERADLTKNRDDTIRNANMKHDGFLWFMNRGIRTDNMIFYTHTGRFSWGWRTPVSADLLSHLLDVVTEFPFPYDVKCADGRMLSGD